MGGRNLIIVAIAVVLGLFAVFLANSYFSGVEQRNERLAEENRLERIVVATQPLAFGNPLTTENVRLQNFPAASVPEGAFRSIEDALRGGRVAVRPIVVGEPVLASKVSGTDGRAVLAANIPEGMRAYTMPINALEGVAGFVRPGDTADILLVRQLPGDGATELDQIAELLLERVQILAIDQIADEMATAPGVGSVATVLVTLDEAQKLSIARRIGTLSMVLRNVQEDEPTLAGPVTGREVVSTNRFIRARNTGGGAPPPQRAAASPPPQVIVQASPQGDTEVRWMGPTMTVVRGTETSVVGVGGLGN